MDSIQTAEDFTINGQYGFENAGIRLIGYVADSDFVYVTKMGATSASSVSRNPFAGVLTCLIFKVCFGLIFSRYPEQYRPSAMAEVPK